MTIVCPFFTLVKDGVEKALLGDENVSRQPVAPFVVDSVNKKSKPNIVAVKKIYK